MERPTDANEAVARELAEGLTHDEDAWSARLRELVAPQARELEALQQSHERSSWP